MEKTVSVDELIEVLKGYSDKGHGDSPVLLWSDICETYALILESHNIIGKCVYLNIFFPLQDWMED